MAEDSVAESGGAGAEAPAGAQADAPPVPAPEPLVPGDGSLAAALPGRTEIIGVSVSAVGHLLAALLIAGSLASARVPPEAIPVKLIPADQAPQKPKTPPPQDQKQAQKPAAPPEQKAPAPEKASPPAAPKEPDKTPAEAGKTPPPGEAGAAAKAPPPGADAAADAKPAGRPWQDIASSLGIADYGHKTTLPDSVLAELSAQAKRCWNVPTGWSDPHQVSVTLRFQLSLDGTVDGEPAVVEFPATPIGAHAAKAAIDAVKQCGPYRLPADQYEEWKDIQLKLAP